MWMSDNQELYDSVLDITEGYDSDVDDSIVDEDALDEGAELDISFSSEDADDEVETRPRYGGESGRRFSASEVVGYDEYVDGSNGVQRIYHNDMEVFYGDDEDPIVDGDSGEELGYARKVRHRSDFNFEDADGDLIAARKEEGSIYLRFIPVDSIIFPGDESTQIRKGSLNTFNLESSISQVGLLEPIHVVPFGSPVAYEQDDDGEDIYELPIYARYTLLHGRRRLEASINLGFDTILAMVDTTVPFPLIEVYQAFSHQSDAYSFSEAMAYARLVRQQQPNMSIDLLENALGYKAGELPKADYIENMKVDFPDIYNKVDAGKMTIEQGFKAIEKEQQKQEKEREGGGLDGQDAEDALRAKQGQEDLEELEIDKHKQELGDRKILPAPIRRAVEARDHSMCQACGYGEGIPDLASMFSVHHMVPVQFGGSDGVDNLILLCQNCHKMAHDYEVGHIPISKEAYDSHDFIKKVVVIGNMMKKVRQAGIKAVREADAALARRMDKGQLSIGRALQQGKLNINAEDTLFNGSPYQVFMDTTKNVRFKKIQGELGSIDLDIDEHPDSEDEDNIDEVIDGTDEALDFGDEFEDITLDEMLLDAQIEDEDAARQE